HLGRELRDGALLPEDDREDLEGRHEPVSRGGVIEEDQVAALLAAEVEPSLPHRLDDVTIADRATDELAAVALEGALEAEVAHDRGHERALLQARLAEHLSGAEGHDGVPVDRLAALVDDDEAIGVSVERDAEIGAVLADLGGAGRRVERA